MSVVAVSFVSRDVVSENIPEPFKMLHDVRRYPFRFCDTTINESPLLMKGMLFEYAEPSSDDSKETLTGLGTYRICNGISKLVTEE